MLSRKSRLRALSLLLCLTAVVAAVSSASAETAEESLAKGNAAFRNGSYEEALAAFSDALAAGADRSLLSFNMGSAYYRLGRYQQAMQAFEAAAENEKLAPLSHYNLGLIARRTGNEEDAIRSFLRARESAQSVELRRRADSALAELDSRYASTEAGKWRTRLSARFGYDDNAFRSPDQAYVDLSQTGQPLITPRPESGVYIPLRFSEEYRGSTSNHGRLTFSYSLASDRYLDGALDSANATRHRIAVGRERLFTSGEQEHRLMLNAVFRKHDETNFDRDDGLARFSNGRSISDRYDYGSLGFEGELTGDLGRLTYGLNFAVESRNYKDTVVVTEYDHDYFRFGGDVDFPIAEHTTLSLGYSQYTRDYSDRHARNSLGSLSSANPTLEYGYQVLEAGISHRISTGARILIQYSRVQRSDEFVGYNDYTQDSLRLAASFGRASKLRSQISVEYRDQEYPHAFAFDVPTEPRKAYDELDLRFTSEYSLSARLSIYAQLRSESLGSSDPRGEYDRSRAMIGVSWRY